MATLTSYNPATGEKAGETRISTKSDIDLAVEKAKKAFIPWRATPITKRIVFARKLAKLLTDHAEEIAELTTKEMGKPIRESREDVSFEVGFINWYADHAQEALGEKIIREDEHTIYKTVYEPWGVCASIGPWNFPTSMASTGITAQILAGNTVIFKPSEYTTLTQKLFIDLFNRTGLPDGVVQGIYGAGDVGKMLVDSDVNLVWFTGSTAVGQEIYKKCAEKFIKPLLELGGSSPALVFADCDFEKTVETIYTARFFNCGQVCSAVKRVFVEKTIFEKFVTAMTKKLQSTSVGDPLKNADFGPLVSKKQLDTLISQVEEAKTKGAKVVTGGGTPKGKEFTKGNYYLPTILTNVNPDMRVITEEVFGPVLPVAPFENEEQAIRQANHTPYGLTAEIFTSDMTRANRVASQINAGGVSVNMDVAYAPDCPIGGYKKSGLGREYGIEGFRELAQLKYICVAK